MKWLRKENCTTVIQRLLHAAGWSADSWWPQTQTATKFNQNATGIISPNHQEIVFSTPPAPLIRILYRYTEVIVSGSTSAVQKKSNQMNLPPLLALSESVERGFLCLQGSRSRCFRRSLRRAGAGNSRGSQSTAGGRQGGFLCPPLTQPVFGQNPKCLFFHSSYLTDSS